MCSFDVCSRVHINITNVTARGTVFIGAPMGDKPVTKHFLALGEELLQRNFQVFYFHQPTRVAPPPQSKLRFIRWPTSRPDHLLDVFRLSKLVKAHQASCVIGNFGFANAMLIGGWLMRVPLRIAWHRTLFSQLILDAPQSPLLCELQRMRKGLIYKMATHMVANSKATKRDLIDSFRVKALKCSVFYNSIEDPLDSGAVRIAEHERNLVVCVGRFHHSKGQDVLVNAVKYLQGSGRALKVEFLGSGPSLEGCKKLAHSIGVVGLCEFRGGIAWNEMMTRVAQARCSVVPSREEAFGFVNIESMAVGTPVVASSVGGIPEIVREGVDGFLVPPDAPEILASRIRELIERDDLREQFSSNARRGFLERFEIDGSIRAQANWIENLILSGKGSGELASSTVS